MALAILNPAPALQPGSGQDTKGVLLGHKTCSECHQAEMEAWKLSPHAQAAYQNLEHEKAADFAKALGISGNLEQSLCADCHAQEPAGTSMNGVTCESCHNAAGPEAGGWFKVHSDYGDGLVGIEHHQKETKEHRQARLAQCDALGMNHSADVYDIAKNCLSCHTVPNEQLVNADHPTSKRFEMVRWSQGAVRHNFALDPKKNAESPSLWLDPHVHGEGRTPENRKKLMFVTGQMVDLEVSLRNRAMASDAGGDFAKDANDRIDDTIGELEDLDHIAEVKQALAAVKGIDKKRLRDVTPADKTFFSTAADGVQAAAKSLVQNHPDGADLGDVDVPSRAEGDAYEP